MYRKSQFIFYSCLAFAIGVGLASFLSVSWLVIYIFSLVSVILIILAGKRTLFKLLAFGMLFFILGLARYQLAIPQVNENHLAYYNNQPEVSFSQRQFITFTGIIDDEPDIRKDHIKYKVSAIGRSASGGKDQKLEGNVLVKAELFPQYNYGDVLEITCQLQQPEVIEDFQYDKYLALSDVYSLCYRGQLKLIDSGRGSFFKSTILKIKSKVVEISGQILPEPQASFLGGLLWGAKKGMPEEVLENFTKTGVTHIIAVSGYNITIIAVALTSLFIGLGLSRKKAFWLIVLGIVFFVVITGSPASIVRAGIMGTVALIAQTIGRAAKMHITLAVVCLLMLLYNPKVLIWDVGFQLSFLATIGLIYLSPRLEKYVKWLPKFFSLRESFLATMSAMILTTPLIIFQFGRFSAIAPLANLLILPIIPLNMAVGFIAIVSGLLWLPLGQVIGYASWLILSYVLKLTEILATISWLQF